MNPRFADMLAPQLPYKSIDGNSIINELGPTPNTMIHKVTAPTNFRSLVGDNVSVNIVSLSDDNRSLWHALLSVLQPESYQSLNWYGKKLMVEQFLTEVDEQLCVDSMKSVKEYKNVNLRTDHYYTWYYLAKKIGYHVAIIGDTRGLTPTISKAVKVVKGSILHNLNNQSMSLDNKPNFAYFLSEHKDVPFLVFHRDSSPLPVYSPVAVSDEYVYQPDHFLWKKLMAMAEDIDKQTRTQDLQKEVTNKLSKQKLSELKDLFVSRGGDISQITGRITKIKIIEKLKDIDNQRND
jgi:hypothetical protein